ncbi:MAG: RNA polymerase sigma factor [Gemmataceae bacterium]|nr:RNA polymerase sigma factor [Gemmataceae bacterium]MCS7271181.1 RNA polymerase sigma factor [Gemmataceae bacterium]MDW8244677.1 RNA polymerase sigma factor [Thermogemmata sp.]
MNNEVTSQRSRTDGSASLCPDVPVNSCLVSDELLLERWEAGDAQAFEQLFSRHREAAYRVAWRLLGNEADALDAVQEGFIKVLTHWRQFRGLCRFRTWLLRVVCHCALDIGRNRQRQRRQEPWSDVAERHGGPPAGHTAELEVEELRQRLNQALALLPERQRQTLVLYVEGGLTYREIAEVTGVSIGTVMSRLFHARQKLRAMLALQVPDP